jgi:cyclopropane-fatty-acyl-phospholipid synthase
MSLASLVEGLLGPDLPVAIEGYDGTRVGPDGSAAKIIVRSPRAIGRIVQAPGELGLARAYVAGELDVEGDIFAALKLQDLMPRIELTAREWVQAAKLAGPAALRRVPPPPEEVRLHGRRHSKERDAAAVSYHYDVSNDFYRLVLGPSMTYSCGVWSSPATTLEQAQEAKYELVSRKLGLQDGQRLLDVGCGWGGMTMHAAREHGTSSVGITLSHLQREWATKAVADAGLTSQVDIRLQDYRDVSDGPFDAICSIGMFEHVGLSRLREYFSKLFALVRPGGRLLNHGISAQPKPLRTPRRPAQYRLGPLEVPARWHLPRRERDSFIDHYVFPDGELHEVGRVVSIMQDSGFEVRHVESLREHYALTLRAWVSNLEQRWDEAVSEVGAARARIWRLYMAASALGFEQGRTSIHQVVAVRPERGRSGLPLRPGFG